MLQTLNSRSIWIGLDCVLLVLVALLNGKLSLVISLVGLAIPLGLLIASHRRRNDGTRSAAVTLALALIAVLSWKNRWVVQVIVFGVFSLLFFVVAVSEVRKTRNRLQGASGGGLPRSDWPK